MINNNPVLFIDSGIGGLPYLDWLKVRKPEESFVYFADNENFPFGTKSRAEIIGIMRSTTAAAVKKYNPKAAVIACNTATVASLDSLRGDFDFPIIGVVPAVKPAAFLSRNKKIGLMASNRTIEDEYTEKLISDFASDCEVHRWAGTDIIDFIENRLYGASEDEKVEILQPAVEFFKSCGVDNLVLGCTHFLLLETELKRMFGDEVDIIDSRDGVVRQIIRVLTDRNLLADRKGEDYFILTGSARKGGLLENYTWISEKYGLCAV